jgi:hypothetical protein
MDGATIEMGRSWAEQLTQRRWRQSQIRHGQQCAHYRRQLRAICWIMNTSLYDTLTGPLLASPIAGAGSVGTCTSGTRIVYGGR